jgi:hypothetical protein
MQDPDFEEKVVHLRHQSGRGGLIRGAGIEGNRPSIQANARTATLNPQVPDWIHGAVCRVQFTCQVNLAVDVELELQEFEFQPDLSQYGRIRGFDAFAFTLATIRENYQTNIAPVIAEAIRREVERVPNAPPPEPSSPPSLRA